MSFDNLVDRGLLAPDEHLIGAFNGSRFTATFDHTTGEVDVAGRSFPSLTAAAMHCKNGRTGNGWKFWAVKRDGCRRSLHAIRTAFGLS